MPNLSPEAEAYRIRRVQEALKGKPATEAQRTARAEGLRRAWAEGRIKPSVTPESIEKTAAKLRGRKRPPELMERIRQANIGKTRSPEVREAFRKRVIEGRKNGKYQLSDAARERMRDAVSRANKGREPTEDHRRKISEANKGRKCSESEIEARSAAMRGRPQTAELTAKGPRHVCARAGTIRNAQNVEYSFRNLTHFIREHPHLFDPLDVAWTDNGRCNAQKRLLGLFGKGKVVPGSWKGWTVVSHYERVFETGDLLQRTSIPQSFLDACDDLDNGRLIDLDTVLSDPDLSPDSLGESAQRTVTTGARTFTSDA